MDATPPELTVDGPVEIWPPNHKYRTFNLSDCAEVVSDNCDASTLDIDVDGVITAIYSDEPEDVVGSGDGKTYTDIIITGDSSFSLRAERQGANNGRVYGVEFEVYDTSGNTTTGTCTFSVPHSQSGTAATNDGAGSGYTVVP